MKRQSPGALAYAVGQPPDPVVVRDRGRESVGSPSLRTGQARFTHPALQLMGSNSETEVFEFCIEPCCCQVEQSGLVKEAVAPP